MKARESKRRHQRKWENHTERRSKTKGEIQAVWTIHRRFWHDDCWRGSSSLCYGIFLLKKKGCSSRGAPLASSLWGQCAKSNGETATLELRHMFWPRTHNRHTLLNECGWRNEFPSLRNSAKGYGWNEANYFPSKIVIQQFATIPSRLFIWEHSRGNDTILWSVWMDWNSPSPGRKGTRKLVSYCYKKARQTYIRAVYEANITLY